MVHYKLSFLGITKWCWALMNDDPFQGYFFQ
jgi:hypothetical protein